MTELIEAAKANPVAAFFGFFLLSLGLNAMNRFGRYCLGHVWKGTRADFENWLAGVLRRGSVKQGHDSKRR